MIPRTSIEEANKHLNLLHGRVGELEKTVSDQHEILKIKDEQLKSKLAEISSAKNAEIESLLRKLRESEQTVVLLQNQIQHKDDTIAKLQYSLGSVETLLTHKTNVEDLLHAMNMAEKNVKGSGINGSGETRTHSQGSANRHKDLQQNGYSGSLSSQEEQLDRKSEPAVKSADTKTHRSKRRGGKEFYL